MSELVITARGHQTAQAIPAGLTGTVSDPPAGLLRLASGDILRGVVVGQDQQSHLLVKTDFGVLKIAVPPATAQALPPGTEITLQIRQAGARIHVVILQASAPQVPPSTVNQATAGPAAADIPSEGAARSALPDAVAVGRTIQGVLQAVVPGPSLIPGLKGDLQPGQALQLRILSVAAPPATPGGASASLPGFSPGFTPAADAPSPSTVPRSTAPRAAARTATPVPNGLPQGAATPGSSTPARAGVNPTGPSTAKPTPGNPAAAAPPALGPGHDSSRPAGAGPNAPDAAHSTVGRGVPAASNSPSIQGPSPAATASSSLDSGRIVAGALQGAGAAHLFRAPHQGTAEAGPGRPVPAAAGSPGEQARAASQGLLRLTGSVTAVTGGGQPVLLTPLGTLTLNLPTALPLGSSLAIEVMANNLVSADGRPPESAALLAVAAVLAGETPLAKATIGPRLAAGLTFIVAALRGGQFASWLTARNVPLGRLAADFESRPKVRGPEVPAGDWRVYPLSLLAGTEQLPARLLLRDKPEGNPEDKPRDSATRFLIEVTFERFGLVRLDGLVSDSRLDLILQSAAGLGDRLEREVLGIFRAALDREDWQGRLTFQRLNSDGSSGEDSAAQSAHQSDLFV